MIRPILYLVLVLCVGLSAGSGRAWPDPAAQKKSIDLVATPKALSTHFSRYGFQPLRTIHKDWGGVRIQLPETEKKTEQTGIYSYFAMSGDFEVTAGFELFDMPPVGKGYGSSVGIGVDTDPPENLKLSLHRGNYPKRGEGFWVTLANEKDEKNEGKKEIDTKFFLGSGETGKLTIRREKEEIICLIAEDYKQKEKELYRLPFPARPIRVVRAFADNGGIPAELDARIVGIKLTADQMTGGIPDPDGPGYGWILWTLGLLVLGGLLFVFFKGRMG